MPWLRPAIRSRPPPLDGAAFCAAAVAVGHCMADGIDGSDDIQLLDSNPVIVGARGQGRAAVDAVALRDL